MGNWFSILALVKAYVKPKHKPRTCGMCGILIIDANCVYMPIEGSPIGPLCRQCDDTLGVSHES